MKSFLWVMCLLVLALAVLMNGQAPPQTYLIVPATLSDIAGDRNGLSDNIAVAVRLKLYWHGIDTPKVDQLFAFRVSGAFVIFQFTLGGGRTAFR